MRNTAIAAMLWLSLAVADEGAAQVLIRVDEPGRSTYSELHEGLRPGTPAADSALAVLRERRPGALWERVRAALGNRAPWNDAHLALTRLAELRDPAYADSAARLTRSIEGGEVTAPPGQNPGDLLPPLHAVMLERERATRGDAPVLGELLAKVPEGDYDVGDAWVLGRLGAGAPDSLRARFLAAPGPELKVRWLTLLSFSSDTASIPLLARVYAAPDSFGVPARFGTRASDGLLWIGTRSSLAALLEARERARKLGSYRDPRLGRGGYDFLANDSSAVISRTGRWLTDWLRELR
ncbi:MAG TPA: hypothetical protein VFZ26_09555 [Gemmatimonadales bacterium]